MNRVTMKRTERKMKSKKKPKWGDLKELCMASLDMTEAKIKQLDELESHAITVMKAVMVGEHEMDTVAKGAMQILNMVSKNRQTLTAREAVRLSMVTSIAGEGQLEKYIFQTQPQIKKLMA